jgi:hypothetical protein
LLGLVHKIFGWFLVFWGTVVSNRDVKCFRWYYSFSVDLLAVSLSYKFEQKINNFWKLYYRLGFLSVKIREILILSLSYNLQSSSL